MRVRPCNGTLCKDEPHAAQHRGANGPKADPHRHNCGPRPIAHGRVKMDTWNDKWSLSRTETNGAARCGETARKDAV